MQSTIENSVKLEYDEKATTFDIPINIIYHPLIFKQEPESNPVSAAAIHSTSSQPNKNHIKSKCVIKSEENECNVSEYAMKKASNERFSFFEIPCDAERRKVWFQILEKFADINVILTASAVYICQRHFKPDDFIQRKTKRSLNPKAVVSQFKKIPVDPLLDLTLEPGTSPDSSAGYFKTIPLREYENLVHKARQLKLKLKKEEDNRAKTLRELNSLRIRLKMVEPDLVQVEKIRKDADCNNVAAQFIVDQIVNYGKRKYAWSEMTIRQCMVWKYNHSNGYEFPRKHNLLQLPSRTTLQKYASLKVSAED